MPDQEPDRAVTAKAVTYSQAGGPDVIKIAERQVRAPRENEVRIKVRAAAVNPTDILLREAGAKPDEGTPVTPGMDAAGVVDAIGSQVSGVAVGDEVMAAVNPRRPEGGAQAAFIVVPAASVMKIPTGTTLEEASTLPMNTLTALFALEIAALQPGETLGISGGAGHLAAVAIAAAKFRGLHVIADAKKEEQDLVRRYGADIVVERSDDFAGAVRKEVPDGVAALLDTALLAEASFPAIRDGGTYIPVRGWQGGPADRGIKIEPVMVPKVLERTDLLAIARELVETGRIKLRVAKEFSPEDAGAAQKLMSAGGVRGRPVIVF